MARSYTPGLRVSARTRHRARRLLPIPGDVLVKLGDQVDARKVVAQTQMPGDIIPLNLAKLLSLPPADVPACMLRKEGDRIEIGEAIARTKGIFGMMRSEYKSTVAGVIESISSVTGQLIIRGASAPLEVKAYLSGTVVEVFPNEGCAIEADVALVQGIFGIGGEASGPIRLAAKRNDQELTSDLIRPDMKGAVVIGGGRMMLDAIRKARDVGVAAVIGGGIDDADLEAFMGYTLGVAITGSERVGLTLILTEGFGQIAMAERTFNLLATHEGHEASVNGATQIRAGVMRPEILVPVGTDVSVEHSARESGQLEIGAPVRVVRDPYFGQLGTVSALPAEPAVLPSGSRARVLEVKFAAGGSAVVPRANVELIEN